MPAHGPDRAVIGILTEDHHFDIAQFSKTKRIEDIFLRRIDGDTGLPLCRDRAEGIDKVRLLFSSASTSCHVNEVVIPLSCNFSDCSLTASSLAQNRHVKQNVKLKKFENLQKF
jgi:hypothetical protein